MKIRIIVWCFYLCGLSACIKNDVPYPYIPGNIEDMAVEGQIGETVIDGASRSVSMTVGGGVDIDSLKILKLKISMDAIVVPDSTACVKFIKFPKLGFDSLAALPSSANTRIRFSRPVKFLLQTYQDYKWTVSVKQVIDRPISVKNQVGKAIVDEQNRTVLIYVPQEQALDKIQIDSLELGGVGATVVPDPQTVSNFFRPQKFIVCRLGKYFEEWTVDVVPTVSIGSTGEADVWAKHATVVGGVKQGATPVIEYKKSGETTWSVLPAAAVKMTGKTAFEAKFTGLDDGTTYTWRIAVDGQTSNEAKFTTEKIVTVPNLNFDTWTQQGKNWYPNPVADNYEHAQAFWATGNEGITSTLAGGFAANTAPTDDAKSGKAVRMVTLGNVNLVGTAAGNLFVGKYKTNMTKPSASVSFGRPFSGARPLKLAGYYKYIPEKISDGKYPGDLTTDQCHIYIRLWDNSGNEIGYGEFVGKEKVTSYTRFSLDVNYSKLKAKPASITIVATSSRYGGEFEGSKVIGQVGSGSTLWVDEFELLYE